MKKLNLVIAFFLILNLLSCKKENKPSDPCNESNCAIGETCVEGNCECRERFSGDDCSEQLMPSKIQISEIKVLKFPQTNKGSNWDENSGPDLYIEILNEERIVIVHTQNNHFEDAESTKEYTYTPENSIDIDNPTEKHTIRLNDYDDEWSSEYLEIIEFYPYTDDNKLPEKMIIDKGGDVAFELTLNYTW